MSVEASVKQIAEFPVEDREVLLDRLDESYGSEEEQGEFIEIDDATRAMLEQELADLDANPTKGYSWEEVLAYVYRKK